MSQTEPAKTHGEKQSEEHLRRKKRGRWSCCLMGCAAPIGFFLLLFGAFFVWHGNALTQVQRIEDEIAARGEPINAKEIDASYRIPDGVADKTVLFSKILPLMENADFVEEQKAFPIVGLSDDEVPIDPDEPWDQHEDVRAFLNKYADLLDQIEEAALTPGETRFALKFSDGFAMLLEHVMQLRGAARLLDLKARLLARKGRWVEAFRTVRAMIVLGESIRNEPIIVSQLVRIALRSMAHNTICDLLPRADWTDEQLKQLMAELRGIDWRGAVQTAFIGERALGRTVFTDPEVLGQEIATFQYLSTYEDQRFHLEFMTKCVNAADLPFPEMMDELQKLNDEIATSSKVAQLTRPLSMLIVPALDSASSAMARVDAADKAVEAQLAIELYRREHAELPATWKDLVPEFLPETPIDSFSGNPLMLRIDPMEILVYTVYHNGVDDGGDDTEQADFVWRVKRRDSW